MSQFATLHRRVFAGPGRLWIPVVGTAMVLTDLALVVWAIQMHRRLGGGFGLPLSILFTLLVLGLVGLGVLLHTWGRRWKDAGLVERLQEDEARFRLLASHLPADVWTTDTELRFTSVSGALLPRLDGSELRVRGRTLYEVFGTRDVGHPVIAAHLRALQGESGMYRRAAGPILLEGRVEPLRDARGGVIGCVGIAVDIAGRRAAEQQQRLLADALEGASDVISVTDGENRFVYVNEAFLRTYGFTREEVIGQTPALLGAPDSIRREILAQTLQGGWTGDIINRRKDGAEIPVSLHTTLIRDSEGRVIGLLGVARDITERRSAEAALRKSQERFELAARAANEAIWELDFTRQAIWWGPAFGRLFGFGPGEATPDLAWWRERIHPEDRERSLLQWKNAVDGGGIHWADEYRLRRADGSYAYVMGRGYVVRDETGTPVRMIGSLRDITERKRDEEAAARLASFPQMSPMPIVEVDAAGNVSFMNPEAERRFPDLRDAPSLHPFVAGCWALFEGSQAARTSLRSREVRVRETWYLQSIHALPDGSQLRIYGSDITERRRVEEALRESERRFRTVLDAMRMIGVGLDAAGRVTYCNDYLLEVTGWPRGEVLGCDWFDRFIPPGTGLRERFARGLAVGDSAVHHRSEILTRAGARRLVEWDSTAVRNEAGRVTGSISIGVDVTERAEAERELRQSEERLRALARHLESAREEDHTRMAREIHDELAQSLTALRLDLSWLAKRVPAGGQAIRKKLDEMAVLTNATIEAGRRIAAELRPPILDDLGLIAALEWFVQDFAKRTKLRATLEVGPKELALDGTLAVTAYRIVQEALANVVRHAEARHVTVRLREQDGALVLEITDDGRGMRADAAVKAQSFGIVGMRERVMAHGGALEIASPPDAGTTVRATIPLERHHEPPEHE